MAKSKETKQEKQLKKELVHRQGIQAAYILGFAGNLASVIMYTLLISDPETGMYVLASVNLVTAAYFLYKAIQ